MINKNIGKIDRNADKKVVVKSNCLSNVLRSTNKSTTLKMLVISECIMKRPKF